MVQHSFCCSKLKNIVNNDGKEKTRLRVQSRRLSYADPVGHTRSGGNYHAFVVCLRWNINRFMSVHISLNRQGLVSCVASVGRRVDRQSDVRRQLGQRGHELRCLQFYQGKCLWLTHIANYTRRWSNFKILTSPCCNQTTGSFAFTRKLRVFRYVHTNRCISLFKGILRQVHENHSAKCSRPNGFRGKWRDAVFSQLWSCRYGFWLIG